MKDFKTVLDGSENEPRAVQLDYFDHLTDQLAKGKIHASNMPPGSGKSFIARTIQRTIPNSVIITTNNVLVDQYVSIYPDLNPVKGKDFYKTEMEYHDARERALYQTSVFNPLSFFYFHMKYKEAKKPTTVIIDEAHKLANMLLLLASRSFSCKYYNIPLELSEVDFLKWLDLIVTRMAPLFEISMPSASQAKLISKGENLYLLKSYLKDNIHKVKIDYEMQENYKGVEQLMLVVKPIELPSSLLRTIFGDARLILLSGSITKFDMSELFPGQSYDLKEYEPLAPLENRPIDTREALSYEDRRNYSKQAERIVKLYGRHNRPNTLIHVSYNDSKYLAKALNNIDKKLPIITHDSATKADKLNRFKEQGGILLGCGMAEGVDLPGDLCRLIIIPRLLFPNKGDAAVQKRMALTNGNFWYSMNTMMTTVQQMGRGVRGETDWCNTYILDYFFKKLVSTCSKYLTKGFKESIK